jgi:adenylate cyclase class 2
MIEAELKAHVRDPDSVRARLAARAAEEISVYRDTYYDRSDRPLAQADRELRVRIIERDQTRRCQLTYKDAAVDAASGSKPEHETDISNASTIDTILRALGYEPVIAFTKHCANFTFEAEGRRIQATLVRVPELAGTFLEVETLVSDRGHVKVVLEVIRRVLNGLGILESDLTTKLYTDMVTEHRQAAGPPG